MPAALDLLGRRWALRLVWELRRDASPSPSCASAHRISPSVLSARLGRAGRRRRSSSATAPAATASPGAGRELARLLYELNRWAVASARSRGGVSSQRERA